MVGNTNGNSIEEVVKIVVDAAQAISMAEKLTESLDETLKRRDELASKKARGSIGEAFAIFKETVPQLKAMTREIAVLNSQVTQLGNVFKKAITLDKSVTATSEYLDKTYSLMSRLSGVSNTLASKTAEYRAELLSMADGSKEAAAELAKLDSQLQRIASTQRATRDMNARTQTIPLSLGQALIGGSRANVLADDAMVAKHKAALAEQERLDAAYNAAIKAQQDKALAEYDVHLSRKKALREKDEAAAAKYREALVTPSQKHNKLVAELNDLTSKGIMLEGERDELIRRSASGLQAQEAAYKRQHTVYKGLSGAVREARDAFIGAEGASTRFAHAFGTTLKYAVAGGAIYTFFSTIKMGFREAIAATVEFDLAMRTTAAVMDMSVQEAFALGQQLNDLGTEFGGTLSEIYNISNALGRAGFEARDLAKGTEIVIKMARLTGDTFDVSTQAVISYQQVFGQTHTIEELGDKLAYVANVSRLSTQDIGTFSNYALSAAKTVGLTVDAIGGMAAAFSNVGVNASTIGTQIRRFSDIMTDTSTAVQDFFLNVGVSQKNLLRDLQSDAETSNAAMLDFADTLRGLTDEEFASYTAGMDLLARDVLAKLRQTSGEFTKFLNGSLNEAAGGLDRTQDIMDSFKVSWESFINDLKDMAIDFSEPLTRGLLDSLQLVRYDMARIKSMVAGDDESLKYYDNMRKLIELHRELRGDISAERRTEVEQQILLLSNENKITKSIADQIEHQNLITKTLDERKVLIKQIDDLTSKIYATTQAEASANPIRRAELSNERTELTSQLDLLLNRYNIGNDILEQHDKEVLVATRTTRQLEIQARLQNLMATQKVQEQAVTKGIIDPTVLERTRQQIQSLQGELNVLRGGKEGEKSAGGAGPQQYAAFSDMSNLMKELIRADSDYAQVQNLVSIQAERNVGVVERQIATIKKKQKLDDLVITDLHTQAGLLDMLSDLEVKKAAATDTGNKQLATSYSQVIAALQPLIDDQKVLQDLENTASAAAEKKAQLFKDIGDAQAEQLILSKNIKGEEVSAIDIARSRLDTAKAQQASAQVLASVKTGTVADLEHEKALELAITEVLNKTLALQKAISTEADKTAKAAEREAEARARALNKAREKEMLAELALAEQKLDQDEKILSASQKYLGVIGDVYALNVKKSKSEIALKKELTKKEREYNDALTKGMLSDEAQDAWDGVFESLGAQWDQLQKEWAQDLGVTIGTSLADGITAAIQSGDIGGALISTLSDLAGSAGGAVGDKLGGMAAESLSTYLMQQSAGTMSEGVSAALGTAMPIVGAAVGQVVAPMLIQSAVDFLSSGKSMGTKLMERMLKELETQTLILNSQYGLASASGLGGTAIAAQVGLADVAFQQATAKQEANKIQKIVQGIGWIDDAYDTSSAIYQTLDAMGFVKDEFTILTDAMAEQLDIYEILDLAVEMNVYSEKKAAAVREDVAAATLEYATALLNIKDSIVDAASSLNDAYIALGGEDILSERIVENARKVIGNALFGASEFTAEQLKNVLEPAIKQFYDLTSLLDPERLRVTETNTIEDVYKYLTQNQIDLNQIVSGANLTMAEFIDIVDEVGVVSEDAGAKLTKLANSIRAAEDSQYDRLLGWYDLMDQYNQQVDDAALAAQTDALASAAENLKDQIAGVEDNIKNLESVINTLQGVIDTLRGGTSSQYGLRQFYVAMEEALTAADPEGLAKAVGDLSKYSGALMQQSNFPDRLEMLYQQSVAANKLERLKAETEGQLTVEEQMLASLKAIEAATSATSSNTKRAEDHLWTLLTDTIAGMPAQILALDDITQAIHTANWDIAIGQDLYSATVDFFDETYGAMGLDFFDSVDAFLSSNEQVLDINNDRVLEAVKGIDALGQKFVDYDINGDGVMDVRLVYDASGNIMEISNPEEVTPDLSAIFGIISGVITGFNDSFGGTTTTNTVTVPTTPPVLYPQLSPDEFKAKWIADHRASYIDNHGPIAFMPSMLTDFYNQYGYSSGGYTGNIGINDIAGVVHGQEYVVNAQTTRDLGLNNSAGVFKDILAELKAIREYSQTIAAAQEQITMQSRRTTTITQNRR